MRFCLGGPIDLKPTHLNSWTVFCNIFSGIPHLTIFSTLKYAAPHPFHISCYGLNQSVARYVRCTIYLDYSNWNTPSLYITRGGWGWGAVLREGDIFWKKTHFLASVSIDPRTKESTLGILKFQKNGFREAPYCTCRSAHDICRLKATIVVPF